MPDNGEEHEGLFDQIKNFLKKPSVDTQVSSGDINKVLDTIGDLDLEAGKKTNQTHPRAFAFEIASNHADIAAVITLRNYDDSERYADEMEKLDDEKIRALKEEHGIEIDKKLDQIKFGDLVIDGGYSNLVDPPDNQISTEVMQKFNDLNDNSVLFELQEYADWWIGRNRFQGDTGLKLEAGLNAGLIIKENYDKIIKARDNKQKIISNNLPLIGKARVLSGNEGGVAQHGRHPWVEQKYVWAIAPAAVAETK